MKCLFNNMSRATFFDYIKKYIPNPSVEPTKEVKLKAKKAKNKETEQEEEFIFIDLKEEPRTKERGKAKGIRKWSNIDTICLHQTAVVFSSPMRMINVPAHSGVLQDGKIVLLHDPTHYLWHGHAINKNSIGIEVSCRAAGIIDNPYTFWRSKKEKQQGKTFQELVSEPTKIQLEATKELCRYYIELAKNNGSEIKYIIPHRSSHKSRISDPGESIWKNVALPIMKEYELKLHPVVGSGNPVPQVWDPINGKGIKYNWRVKGF